MKYPLCFFIFYHIPRTADRIVLSLSQLLQPILHFMPECLNLVMPECLGLTVDKHNLWDNGQDLRVKFLSGSENVHKQVEMLAKEWENYANINLCFVSEGYAHIRVSINPKIKSQSQVGKAALLVVDDEPTMNLAIEDSTHPAELKFHVLHEFGHALGCIHEHCSPEAAIQWNVDEVYSYYQGKKGLDRAKVDLNIFQKYDPERTKFSKFDPKSVMMYQIPSSHTKTGFSASYNWELSAIDKEFIATVYPKPGGQTDFSSRIANAITATRMSIYDFGMGFFKQIYSRRRL